MINQTFRNTVLRYCKNVNKSLGALAEELSYNTTFFSSKLNQSSNKKLTNSEVKLIIKTLVKWQAINTLGEIEVLLKEKNLQLSAFTKEELKEFELSDFEVGITTSKSGEPKEIKQPLHNLPAQTTTLIGREDDIKTVRTALNAINTRLLTLTGPGGTGKTRLSLQVGRDMLDFFEDGVFFIELAAITNPELVPQAIAAGLGLSEEKEGPAAAVKTWLGKRRVLLILDNFEQVLGAADYVSELLITAPNLKVLVTSREVLRVSPERRLIVTTLSHPDTKNLPALESISKFPAIALFVDRAQAVRPEFVLNESNSEIISLICAELDGLPLAIELVAARSNMFAPQGLLSRLKRQFFKLTNGSLQDIPKRHQSLENAINWSYDLLSETEKEILLRLAIFPVTGSLESIEAVCNIEDDLPMDIFEILNSLVEKSLLKVTFDAVGEPRFGMLATVREYLLERLTKTNLAETLESQYISYFLSLAEEAAQHFNQPDQATWYDRLTTEFSNLNTSIEYALDADNITSALKLGAALGRFWLIRGHATVGIFWLKTILDRTNENDTVIDLIRAKATNMLALIYLSQVELDLSEKYYDICFPIFKEANDGFGVSACYKGFGNIAFHRRNLPLALDFYEKGLKIFRLLGDKKEISDYLNNMAVIATNIGDWELALKYNNESLILRREVGDKLKVADSLNNIALLWVNEGDFTKGVPIHEESLKLRQEVGYKPGVADSLNNLGEAYFFQGDLVAATKNYSKAISIHRELKNLAGYGIGLGGMVSIYVELDNPEECSRLSMENLAIKFEKDDKLGLMVGLEDYAYSVAIAGGFGKSVLLLSFVEKYRKEFEIVRRRVDQPRFNKKLQEIRNQLSEEEFDQYWEKGYALSLDDIKKMVPLADVKLILTGSV